MAHFFSNYPSLLARYHGMKEHQESLVAFEKVQFHLDRNNKITCGLKAKSRIGAGTVIPTTSSSMSSDEVERASVSTIQSSQRQLGPEGARIILRPFRFVNHDCSPNCQVGFQSLTVHSMLTFQRSWQYQIVTLLQSAPSKTSNLVNP